MALDEVARFTGRSQSDVMDLVRAGVLEQRPGRRACQITAASVQVWMERPSPVTTEGRSVAEVRGSSMVTHPGARVEL